MPMRTSILLAATETSQALAQAPDEEPRLFFLHYDDALKLARALAIALDLTNLARPAR